MMNEILFYFFAGLAVLGGVLVVTMRNAVHSAVFLITSLLATAGLYLTLNAEFLFVVQIILYVGGIMVLFIFVIMLLNAGAEERRGRSWTAQLLGVPVLIAFLGLICYFVQREFANAGFVKFGNFTGGSAQSVGLALFTDYLLPFEVTSVLILIAILGAIVLARKEMD